MIMLHFVLLFELVAVLYYYLLDFVYLLWILLTLGYPLNIIFYSIWSSRSFVGSIFILFYFFKFMTSPLEFSLSDSIWTASSLDLLKGFQFETSFTTILEISWTSLVLGCLLFFMVDLFQWNMFSKLKRPDSFFFLNISCLKIFILES